MEKINTKEKTKEKVRGYSLIETMIAVTIFALIVVVAIDTLLVAQRTAIKIGLERAAMENVALAIESMTKEIRQGYSFRCSTTSTKPYFPEQDCLSPAGGNQLSFIGQDGKYIVFRFVLQDETIEVYREPSNFPQGNSHLYFLPLVSPEVKIKSLKFYVRGTDPSDDIQPFITIVITGVAKFGGDENIETNFSIQTSVSPRLLEI